LQESLPEGHLCAFFRNNHVRQLSLTHIMRVDPTLDNLVFPSSHCVASYLNSSPSSSARSSRTQWTVLFIPWSQIRA
jgi:hypothetical protein